LAGLNERAKLNDGMVTIPRSALGKRLVENATSSISFAPLPRQRSSPSPIAASESEPIR